jgi:hypothetical protein
LQQLNLGGAQSQQSWRAFTVPGVETTTGVTFGIAALRVLHVPMGGFEARDDVALDVAGAGPAHRAAAANLLSFVHASPTNRQPLAT